MNYQTKPPVPKVFTPQGDLGKRESVIFFEKVADNIVNLLKVNKVQFQAVMLEVQHGTKERR